MRLLDGSPPNLVLHVAVYALNTGADGRNYFTEYLAGGIDAARNSIVLPPHWRTTHEHGFAAKRLTGTLLVLKARRYRYWPAIRQHGCGQNCWQGRRYTH